LSPLETNWRIGKQVNSDNDFIDNRVSMATDSNGYLYVAYDDWYPATNQYAVFVRRSIDEGRTWSTIYIAYSTYNVPVRYPSIAIDPYNNDIFVAVEREWTPNDNDIFVVRCVNGVWSWTAIANVLGRDDRFPSITSEYQYGSGNWQYISYEYVHTYNDRDLMFAKSTDHGATWAIKKLHGDFPDYNVHAQTSITNAEGFIYIAYKWGADYDSPCEIRVERSTDFGNTWTQFSDVDGSSNGCSFPSIAATHGGSTVMVAFQYDFSPNDVDIRYSYSADKGTNWVKGNWLFASGLEDEKLPALTVDGGGSTRNDVGGYFHIACKVGSYAKYRKAHYSIPYSWASPVFVSERWIGKSEAIATRFRNVTTEFHPYVTWNDERTNNIYCSTIGHVHNLNNGLKYESIQEAINANETLSDHILLAESRTYNEMVFMNKSIALVGESCLDTIIYGKGFNYVVEVAANDSTLTGFTIKNGYIGVRVYCTNATIQNNLVTGNEIGIILDYHSSNSKILENNVTLNSRYGMWILWSSNNLLRNNSMTANKYGFGVQAQEPSEFIHDIDVSNTVNGKPIYYWFEERDKAIPLDAGYVALVNCTRITVQNLNLTNNGQGVLLAYTANATIAENNVTDNEYGVRLDYSFNSSIFGNSIANNWGGIVLFLSSNYNSIIRNNIKNNEEGICLYDSSNNSIYHNSFVNNTRQIYDQSWDSPYIPPSINAWDDGYPSGGNYWSDYDGADFYSGPYQNQTSSDGIGDTPYIIDANNTDHYPVMNLSAPPDIAITNITLSKTVIGKGYSLQINVTVTNQGNKIEGFNITAYVNTTAIQTQYAILTSGNSTTLTFTWNTSDFTKGNYTIKAVADPVQDEVSIEDNTLIDGWLTVTILGDVNGDFMCEGKDIALVSKAYGSRIGQAGYVPNADINCDGMIEGKDIAIASKYYGTHDP